MTSEKAMCAVKNIKIKIGVLHLFSHGLDVVCCHPTYCVRIVEPQLCLFWDGAKRVGVWVGD